MLGETQLMNISRSFPTILCMLSLVKLSIFTLLVISAPQVGLSQVRPIPQQTQEELLIRILTNTKRARTISEIPPQFVEVVKREFANNPAAKAEKLKFEQFLSNRYFWAFETVENQNWVKNSPTPRSEMCNFGVITQGNKLDPLVWTAAWTGGNSAVINDADLPISTWTSGVLSNLNLDVDLPGCTNHSVQNHHSVVSTGTDITASGLSTTPAGQSHSILLGNRCFRNGAEKIKKTFRVTSDTFSFWYATVMTDQHGTNFSTQPGFGVYLFDSNGNPITPSSVNLDLDDSQTGNNQFLPANATNPFQQALPTGTTSQGKPILYKGWTQVSMSLSAYMGQDVTIVFANRDCLAALDWAYTYISGFCSSPLTNPSGAVEFNKGKSDCGKGEICFDYTVPKAANGNLGKVSLILELFQNGNLVTTLSSGELTSNGTYCFKNFAGMLNSSIAGFDWKATANFTIAGATISPKEIGKRGVGFVEGQNNDCVTKSCCGIGKNFVKNGDFRETRADFRSDYPFTRSRPFLFPGTELIGDSRIAAKACDRWKVSGHAGGKCEENGGDNFLMINGRTTQANSNPAVVWSQEVKVDGEGEYEFCAFFKDLKQCCFNQNPKITLQATIDGKASTQTATISTSEKPCDWQQVSTKVSVPAGASSVNLQILLDESVMGDGNDLAIDDISLTKKEPVPLGETDFNNQTNVIDANTFSITSTPLKVPKSDCKYTWSAVELDAGMNPIPPTSMSWTATTGTFNYSGFTFKTGPFYSISYKAECDCMTPREDGYEIRRRPSQGIMRLPNNGFEIRKAIRKNQNPR